MARPVTEHHDGQPAQPDEPPGEHERGDERGAGLGAAGAGSHVVRADAMAGGHAAEVHLGRVGHRAYPAGRPARLAVQAERPRAGGESWSRCTCVDGWGCVCGVCVCGGGGVG